MRFCCHVKLSWSFLTKSSIGSIGGSGRIHIQSLLFAQQVGQDGSDSGSRGGDGSGSFSNFSSDGLHSHGLQTHSYKFSP